MPLMSHRFRLILAFTALYLFWGGTYLGMKFALISIPPFIMAGLRHTLAGLVMLRMAHTRKETFPSLKQMANAGLVGILVVVGGNGLVAWAGRLVPSSISSLMIASTPIWMTLINSVTGDKQKPRLIEWLALALGMLGIGLLVTQGGLGSSELNPAGLIALLSAALLWSIGSLYSRQVDMPKASLYNITFQMLSGGLVLILFSLSLGEAQTVQWFELESLSIFAMIYLIFFGSILAYSSYIWLLKQVSPTLVSTYAFVNPVVAVILGWAFANEQLRGQSLVAGAVIVVAVVLLTQRPRGKHHD